MDQKKRREYLIEKLLEKNPGFTLDQRFDQITQLRTLMHLCNHEDMDEEFMEIQDDYLKEELMNLREEREGINVILKQANSRVPKDKVSALEYGLYYIKEEEENNRKTKKIDMKK